jgi:hypothetical protein
MPDEPTLQEQAREAIRSGQMPGVLPSRAFGSPGSGNPCAVCGDPVKPGQMQIELEFRRLLGAERGLSNYHLHVRCFAAWEFERERTGALTASSFPPS